MLSYNLTTLQVFSSLRTNRHRLRGRPPHRPECGSGTAAGHGPSLLKPHADAVFLATVEQFQIFHFLVFHGEEEEAADRLFDLLFGQHLGVEEFLERVLLVAVLHGGLDGAGVGATARADAPAPHADGAAQTPAAAALGALPTGTLRAGQHQGAAADDLAGRHGLGAIAILIGAQDEIVAVDGNFLGVFRLHFDLGHDVVPSQIVAQRFLDGGGVDVDGDVEDEVLVFAAGGGGGLFGGAGDQKG